MFGAIKVSIKRPEHILDGAWNYAIGGARASLRNAVYWESQADDLANPFDLPIAESYRRMARTSRQRAYSLMLSFRWAFECNSGVEASRAIKVVRAGLAAFQEPACATDTCEDCDRPLRHHIAVCNRLDGEAMPYRDARILCPVGREFWSLARVIMASECNSPGLGVEPLLREIARP